MLLPVQNETYNSTEVLLNFLVIEPAAWFSSNFFNLVLGNLTSVYYVVDGNEHQNITMNDVSTYPNGPSAAPTLSFSITLNLTAGAHSVAVSVEANSTYLSNYFSNNPLSTVVVQVNSEPINFTVVVPEPVIVTPENMIYNESSVPLVFTVDTSAAAWIGYSLDGKERVTITGNTTLTGLSNGEHNITVYANDTLGNIYASHTVNFTVALPLVTKPFPTTTVAAVSGALAVVVLGIGLLVYFKKRNHARINKHSEIEQSST
jgi:hypothetical protein